MIDVKVCRNIQIPSYLTEFLEHYSTVTLVLNKRNEDDKPVIIDTPLKLNSSGSASHLDLTGSPLKVELNGGDDDLEWTMIYERFPSWTPEESKHLPISVQEARKFLRYHTMKEDDKDCDNGPLFCVCDGSDPKKTAILGVSKYNNATTFCVNILGCFPQTHQVTSFEYMKKVHLINLRTSKHYGPVDFLIKNVYYIFGDNLKNCPNIDRAENNGSVAIRVISKECIPELLEKYSSVELILQVILGHRQSAIYSLWKELEFLKRLVTVLKETPTPELEDVHVANDPSSLTDIADQIYNCLNAQTCEKESRKSLDLGNLRAKSILDILWNIVKNCRDVSDLRDAFHIIFEELAEVQSKIQIPPGNGSDIVDILLGILNGTLAVPTVSFPQAVEFLLELGLEYVKNDYMAIISYFCTNFYDGFIQKWNISNDERTSQSQALKRKTRTMLSKVAVIDTTNIDHKLVLVSQMHILTEFLFLSKEYCQISEENFEDLCTALSNNFIYGNECSVKFDDMVQRLHEFTFTLNSTDVKLIKGYQLKLKIVNDVDPFTLNISDLDNSIHGVPPITNMDIVSYLVLTHSFYSKDQMKSYKSLQAYKYFEAGLVTNVGTKVVNDFYIVVGKVKHSLKASAKPLDVWCITARNGSICTAHCTCMAGSSEVCSHVGAILFTAEHANRRKEEASCTDILSAWVVPSTSQNVPLVPVSAMNWGKSTAVQSNEDITPVSVNNLLKKMAEMGHDAVIMRIVDPFATEIAKQITSNMLPTPLDIFDENYIGKSYMEIAQIAKAIDLTIDDEARNNIEKATRNQSESENWYIQRAGRITASNFKAVCRTNKEKPSLSLIKLICYPTKMLFHNKATLWGATHEDRAVKAYQHSMMKENHDSLVINKVGFIVSKYWPQFGASPDRLVYCECCEGGCVEVKCPYVLSDSSITDIHQYADLKGSCLVKTNGQLGLDKSHSYFYQVQMQIFVTELKYCDFVVWSPKIFFKTRIYPDFEFWEHHSQIGVKFHLEVIMPELIGKYFTRKEGTADVNHWCVCNGVDDGRPMIRCDGDDCEMGWFHLDCVGISDIPHIPWYCLNCSSEVNQ